MSGALTALVLAGERDGRLDPLAADAGVRLKALAPVAGRPMIAHVLDALAASHRVGEIRVCVNDGAGLGELPEVRRLAAAGRLRLAPARPNLVDSVLAAVEGAAFPVLIVTADSVLLTPDAIAEFDIAARRRGAEVAVALARRESVLGVHPDGQRKFYRCSDGAFSNCNMYWIGEPTALAAAELFRSGGQFVKHPMRVVGALGLRGVLELVRFRFGLSALEASFRRLSGRFGLRILPIVISDGAAAIDVDHARSLRVAEEVLAFRAGQRPALAAE
ncbi:NTP transferase domain-containing protein [Methylopila turkensis]|uniref:MobA-like NTP transferase domain-containing protein n=1 Tax=Methylopila turkensis TaxID=1437816 RepID=A0A9W6N8A2_9HYPH|nr:NTP transferase domain-containing protein [Methylopila turkensis]GLK81343.1 hypothetical protein GCM10008174_30840 [Methylopila turkensis]